MVVNNDNLVRKLQSVLQNLRQGLLSFLKIVVDNISIDTNTISTIAGDLVIDPFVDIDVNTNFIKNVKDPVNDQDAATKHYVTLTNHTRLHNIDSDLDHFTDITQKGKFVKSNSSTGKIEYSNIQTSDISSFDSTVRGLLSNNVTGLTYTSSTGATSLTTGYVIPTTTEESAWNSAVSNSHSHSNKVTLDNIQEALTTSLKNSYDSAVTASHSHSNKSTLDSITAALTTALKSNYDTAYTHTSNTSNPHNTTASQVGLGNVANLTQVDTSTDQTIAGTKTFSAAVLAANFAYHSKYWEIDAIKDIIGANLLLCLLFDEKRTTTIIKDRSGNGYNATLSASASSFTPLTLGSVNSLIFNGSNYWDITDNAAFSFVSGGVDTDFSIFSVIKTPASFNPASMVYCKCTFDGSYGEHFLRINTAGRLDMTKYDNAHGGARIEKYCSSALNASSIYSVGSSCTGSTSAGIKLYQNGSEITSTTTNDSGGYVSQIDTTAKPSNYYISGGVKYSSYLRQSCLVIANSVLTTDQFAILDEICRGLTTSL